MTPRASQAVLAALLTLGMAACGGSPAVPRDVEPTPSQITYHCPEDDDVIACPETASR